MNVRRKGRGMQARTCHLCGLRAACRTSFCNRNDTAVACRGTVIKWLQQLETPSSSQVSLTCSQSSLREHQQSLALHTASCNYVIYKKHTPDNEVCNYGARIPFTTKQGRLNVCRMFRRTSKAIQFNLFGLNSFTKELQNFVYILRFQAD